MTRNPLNFSTGDVAASPADATETVIAILDGVTCQFSSDTFKLHGYVNIILDNDATDCILRVRRDSLAGDLVGSESSISASITPGNGAATNSIDVNDTPGDVANATYVLTAECSAASGPSEINDVSLNARCD